MTGSTREALTEVANAAESLGYSVISTQWGQISLAALGRGRFGATLGTQVLEVTISTNQVGLVKADTLRQVLRPLEVVR